MAGRDPLDSTSADVPVADYGGGLDEPVRGMRIGVPTDYFGAGLDPHVKDRIEAGIAAMERLGCRRVPLRMPHTDYAVATYYLIATAEASSNLARYDGVRYGVRVPGATLMDMYRKTRGRGFGSEVKRRIMLGTYALSAGYYDAYYLKAQKVRALIAQDFAQAFEQVDVIVTGPHVARPGLSLGRANRGPRWPCIWPTFTHRDGLAGRHAWNIGPGGQDARRAARGAANIRSGVRRGANATAGPRLRAVGRRSLESDQAIRIHRTLLHKMGINFRKSVRLTGMTLPLLASGGSDAGPRPN